MKVQKEYGSRGVVVVGVTNAEASAAQGFIDDLGVTYPVLSESQEVCDAYGVWFVPKTYLVGPDGKIVAEGLDSATSALKKIP